MASYLPRFAARTPLTKHRHMAEAMEHDGRLSPTSGHRPGAAASFLDRYFHYVALAPTVLTLLLLTVFPTLFLVYVVFHKVSAGNAGASEFVGIDNFLRLATD